MRFETPLTPHMRAGLVLGFAGILAAALVGHTALVLQLRGMVINMPTTVSNLMHGLSWAALGPAAVWLARRRPVAGRAWALNLLLHLVAATAANAAVGTLVSLANIPLRAGVPDAPSFEYLLAINFFSALLIYPLIWLGIVTATQAFDAVAEARQRRQRAAELEAQLVTSQLDALRAQLDPHFLFNTLNAISTLMGRDVTVARSVLADLAALLRRSLDQMGAPEVQLVDEIDFLKHYLAIEQARFEDRLQVELDVPAALHDALVPPLVLQPLVENAIKHGIAPQAEGGVLCVEAWAEEESLLLRVTDDGPGLGSTASNGTRPALTAGIGLTTTRERLHTLYADAASLETRALVPQGFEALVRLPLRT